MCAAVFDAYSPDPISIKKLTPELEPPITDEIKEELPAPETAPIEKISRKRGCDSKDDKENVPTKIRKKNNFDKQKHIRHRNNFKNGIKQSGKIIKGLQKRVLRDSVRNRRMLRRIADAERYKPKNPIRVMVGFFHYLFACVNLKILG